MTDLTGERSQASSPGPEPPPQMRESGERKFRPVLLWATLGVVYLLVQIVAYTGWIASGDAKPTPRGPTPIPTWQNVAIHTWEGLSVVASLLILYFFLI